MSSPDKYETVSLSRDLENIENIDVVYSDTESDQNGENKEIDDNCRWADPLCLNTVSNDDEDVDPDVEIEEWQLQDLSEMTKLYYNAINEQKKLMSRFNKRLKIIAEIKSAYLRDVVTMKTVINGIVKTEEMKEIMKVWKDTLPSLDLQKGLMLYSPTSAQLLVKPCNKCGGHLEVEYHDVARAEILERKLEKLYTKYEDTRIELLRSCEMYNLMESKQGGIVSKYENEKKVLYAECAKQRELVEKASTINIQLDASNKKFREENRKYKAENERLMEELKDHNKLQEEFDSLQPNIEMLEEKIRILNEKLNGLNEVIVTKDKVIEDLKAKDVELEEEETHLRHNIKELEVEIDALKEANAKAEQTLEVEEVKFQELAIVLNPLKEELSQLKYSTAIDNEMTDRLIEDLRVDARHNEMQYRLMKEEVERLQLALQQKDCMIEEQNEALAQKSEELQQLETALYEKNEQLHGVQSFIGKEVTSGADSNMTRFKPGFDPDRSTRQQQLDVSFNSDDPEHPDHHIKKAIQRARHNSYAQIDAVASAKKKEMELAAAVDSNLQESIAQIVAALGGSDVDSNANSEEEEEGEEEELETEENAAGVEITDITKPADEAKESESESESKSKSKSKSKPKKKRKLKKKLKLADMMRTTISTMLQKHDSIRQLSVSAPSPPVPIVKGPVGANGINGNKNTRSSSSVQKYEPDHDVLQEHENEDEPDDDHNVLNIVTDLSDSEHGTSPVIHSYSNSEGYDTAVSVNKAVGFFKQPTSNAPNRRNAEAKISGKYAADTHVNRAEGSEGNLTAAVKKYNPKKKSNQYLSSPTSFKTGDGGLAEVRTGASEEEKSLREAILCTLTATVGAVAAKKAFNALQPVIKVYGCLLHGAMESFWEALVMGKKSADFMTKLMVIFEKIVSCNKDSVSSADVAKICQECVPLALSTIGGSGMIETWEVSTKLNETLKHELAPRVNHTTGQLTYKHYLEYFGVDEDFYTAKIDMAEEGLQKMIHYETETLQHLNGYIVSVLKEWSEAKAIFVDIDSILERERAKVKEAADLEYNKIITELSATFAMLEKARGEVKEKGTTIETQHAELVVLRAVPAKLQTAEEKIRDLLSKISHLGQEASVQSTKYKELNTHCEFLDKRIEETMKDYTDMKTKEKSARARIDVLQINLVEKNTELKEVTAELQDVLDVNDRRLHALVHVEVQTEPDCCDGAVQTEFICPPMSLRTAARVTNSSKTAQYPMVFSTTFNETSTGLEDAHEAGSTSSSVTSPFLSPIRQKNNHWSASTSSNTSVAGSLSLGSYSSNVGSGSLSSLASSKYMQQQLLEARGDYPAGAGILQANFGTNPATASLLNRLNIRLDPALNIKGKVAKSPMRMQKQYEKSEKSVIAGTGTNSIASQSTESNNYQCRKQFASHPESPLRNNEISDFSDDLLDDVPTVSAGASVWPYSHLPGGVEYEDDNESTMSSITSASHAHNSGQAGGFSKHIVNAQAFPPPGGFEVISRNLNLHTSTGQPIHNQGQNTGIVEKLSPEFNGTVLTTSVAADTLFMGRELIGTVNNSDNYSTIMHSLKSSAVEQCINNSVGQILNSRSSRSSTCSVGSGELHSGSGKSASSGMALSHSSLDSFMNTQGAVEADVAVNQGRPPGDHGSPKGSLQSTLDMFRIGGSKGRGMRGTSNSKRSNTSSDSGTDTNKAVPRKNSPVKTSRSRGMNGGIPGTSLQSGFGVAPTSSTIQLPKLSSYGLSISSR